MWPEQSDNTFEYAVHSLSDRLYEPSARTATGGRRFSYYAPRIWNSLPTNITSAESYGSFKSLLKTHLFDTV